MTGLVDHDRRALLAGAVAIGASAWSRPLGAQAAAPAIMIDPRPSHALSAFLHMQFMEPLGTTDGSVEASWDRLGQRWRPDLVEATRALAPPMLRWGGLFSAYYRWREGVGPRAQRRPMHNLMWGGVETNQVGTAEFWDFCQMVGAEPLMCVNFLSEGDRSWAVNSLGERRAGDAAEAADWVRYCNAPRNATRLGDGRRGSMPIRYWQIGNETSYASTRFSQTSAIGQTAAFARAMRAADPNLTLIAWGDSGWAGEMIAGTDGLIDMLDFHDLFDPGPACRDENFRRDHAAAWDALMAASGRHDDKIRAVRDQTGSFPIALTESHFQIGGRNRGELNASWATGVAFARFQNLHQRHGDVLRIANIGDFCGNRWMTNVVMLPTPKGKPYLMPVGKVAQLYRAHVGTHVVTVRDGPSPLDVVASRAEGRFFVHVVNTDRTLAVTCPVVVSDRRLTGGMVHQMTAEDPFAAIVSAEDDPVILTSRTLSLDRPITFPPASVSVVELVTLAA